MISDAAMREQALLDEIHRLQDELRAAYRLRKPLLDWNADLTKPAIPREIQLSASLLVPGWPKLDIRSVLSAEMWNAAPPSLSFLVEDAARAIIRTATERRAVDEGSGTA